MTGTGRRITPEQASHLAALLGEWVAGKVGDVDDLVAYAEQRAAAIPKQPGLVREVEALRACVGELLIRVAVLELDLQRRDAERRQKGGRS